METKKRNFGGIRNSNMTAILHMITALCMNTVWRVYATVWMNTAALHMNTALRINATLRMTSALCMNATVHDYTVLRIIIVLRMNDALRMNTSLRAICVSLGRLKFCLRNFGGLPVSTMCGLNGGYPKSSILDWVFPSKNQPFWGTSISGSPHISTIVLPLFYHCSTIVLPLFYHCSTIVLPLFYHCSTIVLPLFYHCSTIALPLFYHCSTIVLPLFYHCSTIVLPLFYHCSTIVLPLFYHCSTIALPLFYHCSPIVLPLFYHCSTIVLPLFYHCSTIILPLFYHCSKLPLFYHCSTIVLPLFYHCSTIVLPLFYHCSTIVLPLFYHCSTIVLPLFYHCSTLVLPFFYHFSTLHFLQGSVAVQQGSLLQPDGPSLSHLQSTGHGQFHKGLWLRLGVVVVALEGTIGEELLGEPRSHGDASRVEFLGWEKNLEKCGEWFGMIIWNGLEKTSVKKCGWSYEMKVNDMFMEDIQDVVDFTHVRVVICEEITKPDAHLSSTVGTTLGNGEANLTKKWIIIALRIQILILHQLLSCSMYYIWHFLGIRYTGIDNPKKKIDLVQAILILAPARGPPSKTPSVYLEKMLRRVCPSSSTQFSRALVEFNAPHCSLSLHSESNPSPSKGASSSSRVSFSSTLASLCSTSVGRFWSKRMEFLSCSASKLCSSRTSSYNFCSCSCNTSAKGRCMVAGEETRLPRRKRNTKAWEANGGRTAMGCQSQVVMNQAWLENLKFWWGNMYVYIYLFIYVYIYLFIYIYTVNIYIL